MMTSPNWDILSLRSGWKKIVNASLMPITFHMPHKRLIRNESKQSLPVHFLKSLLQISDVYKNSTVLDFVKFFIS